MSIVKRIVLEIVFILLVCVLIRFLTWSLIIALIIYAIYLGIQIIKELK